MSNIRRLQPIDNKNKGQQEIEKELDSTNPEDLPEYFDYSLICSIRRNLRNYQREENGTTRST